MAKVMVSLPDELLEALDAEASRRGTTRSGLLRELVADALARRSARRAERIAQIGRAATGHGGNVAGLLKRHRPDR